MPFDERHIAMIAYRSIAFAVAGQVFVQEVAICLATDFQPHGVIVILLDFGNLDVAHDFSVVHHGEAAGPAVVIHSRLGDAFGAAHDGPGRGSVLVHFLVARVTEGIAVLFHEGYLLFELVGSPQVIAIEEGYPPAFGLAEGAIAAVGGTAVAVVFEVTDFRREIPAFAGMTIKFAGMTTVRVHFGKLSELAHDVIGVVGAGVVNDNQFPVGVCLRHHGAYGLRDIRGRVVAGHDNRHQGRHSI